MKAFLGIARANFLLLPVTLVAVGAAAAAYDGAFDPLNTFLALIGLTAMHASVNSLSEYSDFRRGIDLDTEGTRLGAVQRTGRAGTLEQFRQATDLQTRGRCRPLYVAG